MLIWMLLVDAAVLGVIVALMEQEAFPGWAPMIGTSLIVSLVSSGVGNLVPGPAGVVAGFAAAGVAGAILIGWLCDMSLRRALVATGIFLAIRIAVMMAVVAMIGPEE